MLKELVAGNRSYRRFFQEVAISSETLLELIELARLTATGANKQSLKFKSINSKAENEKVFSCLSWAGYLKDWQGPEEGEKPAAYIVVLNNPNLKQNPQYDVGLACQSILLGAVEKGLGGCMFGSVNREKLKKFLHIPNDLDIMLVVALGKPKEQVRIDEAKDGDVKYWRDENQVHHVPKRKLEDLVI
ncbi:MAG: nitroreductase family protein [Candidatus Cloacimonadales bacterium]|nr:nitroreductase family protein [Candidatus Cloacimonadales bacterium]